MNNSWQPRQYHHSPNGIDPNRKCNTLWIGDLEKNVDESYLQNIFGEDYKIVSVHVYKDKLTNGKVAPPVTAGELCVHCVRKRGHG